MSTTPDKEEKPLSKRQAKKQARWEKKVAGRKERRQLEKVRKKEKKQQRKANGELPPPPVVIKLMKDSACQVRVAVDVSFGEVGYLGRGNGSSLAPLKYMNEAGTKSTLAQLGRCYSANRRADNPLQYYIVGLSGRAKEVGGGGVSH